MSLYDAEGIAQGLWFERTHLKWCCPGVLRAECKPKPRSQNLTCDNPKVSAPEPAGRTDTLSSKKTGARSVRKLSVGTKVCGEVNPTPDSQEPSSS